MMRIQTKWKFFVLSSLYSLTITKDLCYTKAKILCWVDQHYLKISDLQHLVIFNIYTGNIENFLRWLFLKHNFLLNFAQLINIWYIIRVSKLMLLHVEIGCRSLAILAFERAVNYDRQRNRIVNICLFYSILVEIALKYDHFCALQKCSYANHDQINFHNLYNNKQQLQQLIAIFQSQNHTNFFTQQWATKIHKIQIFTVEMHNKLAGAVVIITGASSGLGKQLAEQFSLYPVRLIITGRNKERLDKVKTICELNKAVCVQEFLGDLNSQQACAQLIDYAIEKFSRIDYLVLNAGINAHFNFAEGENMEIFEKVMKTNFYANLYLTKYALPYLRKSNANILVISSISGKLGLPERSAYCASKFALSGFFQSLRTQEQSLSITQVYPTSLDTPMRQNDLLGPKVASSSSNNKQQSAKVSAELIVRMLKPGHHDIYIPVKLWLGTIAQPLFPNWMRKKIKEAAKL